VSPLPFADPLSIGEAPHHFESHPGSAALVVIPEIAAMLGILAPRIGPDQAANGVHAVFDLSLDQILIRAGACVVIAAIHGAVLAAIAHALGDRGPQFDERLTLNPLSHLDILGAAAMILSQLGWIRPVAIDPAQLRLGRLGLVIAVVASLALTLIVAQLLFWLRIPALLALPIAVTPTVLATLNAAGEMAAWFVAFNFLPVPPLTGGHLLIAARPAFMKLFANYRVQIGVLAAALVLSGVVQPVVRPIREAILYVVPGS
jgi:Zn-dependent protease